MNMEEKREEERWDTFCEDATVKIWLVGYGRRKAGSSNLVRKGEHISASAEYKRWKREEG